MVSNYLLSKRNLARKLVDILLEKFEYVSLLGKHTVGKQINVNNFTTSIVEPMECECGFVVKVFHKGLYSEYSFTEFNEENFDNIVSNIENELNVSDSFLSNKMKVTVLNDEPLKKDFESLGKGKKFTTDQVIKNLSEIKDIICKEDSRIIQGVAMNISYVVSSMFVSKNRELTQSFNWDQVLYYAVAREGDIIQDSYFVSASDNLEECFNEAKLKASDAAKLALELLHVEPIVPGEYDIITDSSITGLIAHEAFGHGVEMDMFVKSRAKSRKYINKPVASSLVSMHDGAAAVYSSGSYFFDDDGVLAQDTLIIDKGILVNGISDVIAANELGTKPTGNSRRESFERKAYTRMTNTFFSKGDSKLDDMIKSIKHGYMLFQTSNGMEDPKNWNIQCVAQYGREIKDGKFTGKIVSPVVMSGYVPDLLMSISMVSNDFKVIGSGHCGKGHKEWVPVSDGGPCLKARCKLS